MVVTGAPRKRLVGKPARGFESHPLRQISACAPIWRRGWDSGAPPLARLRARIPTPIFPIALPFGRVGGDSGAPPLARLRARIPTPIFPIALPFGRVGGDSGAPPPRTRLRARIPTATFRLRSHLAEWGGFRRSAAHAASGANPDTNLPDCAPIWRSGGDSGAPPPRTRLRARIPTATFRLRSHLAEWGGFRRSAARAASGANPDSNLPIALPFGGVGDSGAPPRTRLRVGQELAPHNAAKRSSETQGHGAGGGWAETASQRGVSGR